MTSHYVKTTDAAYHIAMLHGTLAGQEGHDAYAPFQLQQLIARDFDYWALGHIHKRALLHEDPFIIYPGNVQGRHIKETGEKRLLLDSPLRRFSGSEFYQLCRYHL